MLDYGVLGALRVVDGGGDDVGIGGPRQRRLLAMLLLHRNEVVSADRLADAVFAGDPPPAARTTLRSYVARLRRVVDVGADGRALTTRSPGYVLRVEDDALDAARFERLLGEARARWAQDDPVGSGSMVRKALGAWRGDAYAEFADEDWARPEAQRLDELRRFAQEHLIDAELACGSAAELIPRLEVLVAEDPLREAFRSRLMVALYRCGRQVDALRVAQAYRELLGDEVGLAPSPELDRLEHQILEHDPALKLPEPAGRPLRGYRLGERLGTGRDGTVHVARLTGVDRDLAIRIVPPDIADRPDVVRSFDSVLRRVASLRHEAIVPIHDHWREPGAAYVVMRRMRGGTLRDRLDRGPLPAAEAAAVAARVGSALEAAARQDLVHGRVIPESVFLDENGSAHLADFALREADGGRPEDDVVAFAALVAEALTGRRPNGELPEGVPASVAKALADKSDGRGVPPIGEVVAAVAAELAADAGVAMVDAAAVNPYKGLRAFDESDAADFFGRGHLVDEILGQLSCEGRAGRLVLVVGGSGSGKSSVVRAGVLPRVRGGAVAGSAQWFLTTMVPGAAPFRALAQGLCRVATGAPADGDGSSPALEDELADELALGEEGIDAALRRRVPEGGQLLLVVDQLEELFTLAPAGDQRAFLDGLVHALSATDSRLRVVATLRADYYDRPLRFNRFGAAVRAATVTVPAMSAAELEGAIVGPAARIGRQVELPLVAELVAAVADEAAALPSLQFTLYELAERSADGCLTLAAYRQLGGLGGAIASRAEALYRSLDDEDRAVVRRMFGHLVVIGAEAEPTRRRTPRSELAPLAPGRSIDALVDAWVHARLLGYDRDLRTREPTVEVAHEALLREWPRLRRWMEEDREAIVVHGELREAAAGWVALGRDPGALYRGARLDTAVQRLEGRELALPELAREFLEASRAARDEDVRREAERIARQNRANRRLRLQLAALGVALVVALVGGLLAWGQRGRAQHEEDVAVARELAAASVANLDDDAELSVLLALEAVERASDADRALPEAEGALHRAVGESRIALSVPGLGGSVGWSADGELFVTEGPEDTGLVDVRDAATGESVLAFTGHEVDINEVAFSADAPVMATTGDDGAARVWNPTTGEEVASLEGDGQVHSPSFSADGSRLAAAWSDEGLIRVLEVATGDTVLEMPAPSSIVSLSPDGERLVVGVAGTGATVVDATSGEELVRIESPLWNVGTAGPGPGSHPVAWSPDGRWIATGGRDLRARIWDARSGDLRATLSGHTGPVNTVAWAPGGELLATGSGDGTARVWIVVEGFESELLSLAARDTQGGIRGIAFSPDGKRLLTGDGAVRAAKIWEIGVAGGAEWANTPAPWDTLGTATFTPDGRTLVVTGDGVPAVAWDLGTVEPRLTFGDEDPDADPRDVDARLIEVSPDGAMVATAVWDGPASVWTAGTGDLLFTAGSFPWVNNLAWSPDGEVLAVTGPGGGPAGAGSTEVVDRTGRTIAELHEDAGFVPLDVEFALGGTRIVTTRQPTGRSEPKVEGVRVWDWEEGEVVADIPVWAETLAVDPSGTRFAVNDHEEGASVWDVETGARVARLAGHTGSVTDLAFDPAGETVATASLDGTVRLWSPDSGEERLVLRGHDGPVGSVAFSPDGARLASVGLGGARVWALDLDELVGMARHKLTRSLTDAECRQFLHLDRCP